MSRKHFEWKLRTRTLQIGERTLIMGVLNVTPDSFSDGGDFMDPDRAFAQAMKLEEQGADIIDIGAESTRPGSTRVAEGEELRRLIPVLKRLEGRLSIPISVDTYKAAVAVKALEHGAEIINDPSGLTFDQELARVINNSNAGLILNHMRGTPETWAKLAPMKDPAATVIAELDAAIHRAQRAGVDPKRIAVDPGLGFGKRREQNSELIARLGEFLRLNRPVLVGPSRKQFLQQETEEAREFGTAAAVAAAILNGAHIVRVHDVEAMRAAIQVADAVVDGRPEPKVEEKPERIKKRFEPKTVGPEHPTGKSAGPIRPMRPNLAKPVFNRPAGISPAMAKPALATPAAEPAILNAPSSTAPVSAIPAVAQVPAPPVAATPAAADPVPAAPVATPPVATPAVMSKPASAKPVLSRPVLKKPVIAKPAFNRPAANKRPFTKPPMSKQNSGKPVLAKPVLAKPVLAKPVLAKPILRKSDGSSRPRPSRSGPPRKRR